MRGSDKAMPPLASEVVDADGVALIRDWIDRLCDGGRTHEAIRTLRRSWCWRWRACCDAATTAATPTGGGGNDAATGTAARRRARRLGSARAARPAAPAARAPASGSMSSGGSRQQRQRRQRQWQRRQLGRGRRRRRRRRQRSRHAGIAHEVQGADAGAKRRQRLPRSTIRSRSRPRWSRTASTRRCSSRYAPGDNGHLIVVERGGTIQAPRPGDRRHEHVPRRSRSRRCSSGGDGEMGLLGMAFHPDFPDDPRFFVNYTTDPDDLDYTATTHISSFEAQTTARCADAEQRAGADATTTNRSQTTTAACWRSAPTAACSRAPATAATATTWAPATPPGGNGQSLDTPLAKILRIDVDDPDKAAPGNLERGRAADLGLRHAQSVALQLRPQDRRPLHRRRRSERARRGRRRAARATATTTTAGRSWKASTAYGGSGGAAT